MPKTMAPPRAALTTIKGRDGHRTVVGRRPLCGCSPRPGVDSGTGAAAGSRNGAAASSTTAPAGSRSSKTAPTARAFRAAQEPPCALAIAATIERPSPAPPSRR